MPLPVNRAAPEKPGGEIVKFYLSSNTQYKKGERITMNVNGYEYPVIVGQKNELPEDVLKVLESNESKTIVPDLDKYDPDRGGMPRPKEQINMGAKKIHYVKDFDVERL